MTPDIHIMPLDRCVIKSSSTIHPHLRTNPKSFVRDLDLPVRTSKPTRGRCEYGPTWNLSLDVLAYKGITLKLRQVVGNPLTEVTIEFNPGTCLFGHNGRILLLTEFLDALALLVTQLRPLLRDAHDWVDLVPGLRQGGCAYWSYLEIPFQLRDPNGALLGRLRHSRHPSITKASRHWPGSIRIGGERSILQLAIYRKADEMANRRIEGKPLLCDEKLDEDSDILRLEARMKEKKLPLYFGNGDNIEVIDGKERLVWFYPMDLIRGHRDCYKVLEGVFSPEVTEVGKSTPIAALAKMLAQVADDPRSLHTFPQLLAVIRHYTGASADTIRNLRKAGFAELSRRSGIDRNALFSDTTYATQIGIASEEAEQRVLHESIDPEALRAITRRYCPEWQPFHPHTELPTYCR